MTAPERIWAKLDRATVYMDGSSPLVASTREFNGAAEYVTVSTQNTGNLNRTRPDGWLVIGPQDDKRVVLDAMKYNPTDPAFWYGGQIPDDASIHPLFASADAVNGDLLVAAMPDEDDIEQAITDSIDLDWTPRDAAKAVMRLLSALEATPPAPKVTEAQAEVVAKLIARWLGRSWEGLPEGRVTEKGFPVFSRSQRGWGFNGRKGDMIDLAHEALTAAQEAGKP